MRRDPGRQGRGGVRARFQRLLRRLTPPTSRGALVLLYHRAALVDPDPWRLAVRPVHLEEHLAIIARHARPTTVASLLDAMNEGEIPERTVVVTFDDGYGDLATAVRPRLDRDGVPATMFLVSRAIGRDREFWWDALARALLGPTVPPGSLHLTIGGVPRAWDIAEAPSRADAHRDVWAALRACAPVERDRLAEEVLSWAGLPSVARPSHRTLTGEELTALATDGLVEIGTHTANHPWLAGLTPAGQAQEVLDGRSELEDRIGRRVATFAYPHGGRDDIGGSADAVRAASLTTAFLAVPGLVRPRTDRFALPRLFVDDVDGEGFARLLWRHAGINAT